MSLPITQIQFEARPTECHRVQFRGIDEHTGRPVTSTQYATREAALEAWAPAGATEADLVTTDARIDAIRAILLELEAAFAESGSPGVTFALARRDFARAESSLHGASIDLAESAS